MRPISISLSPNVQKDDVFIALKNLLNFWKNDISIIKKFESDLDFYFGGNNRVFTLNSGRSSLFLILKSLGVTKGDEVIIQSFTCSAVANPIIWLGAKPIYCDINDEYNLSTKDLVTKISSKTKAIVVQHTFGIPGDIQKIKDIVADRNIIIIEDLAHGLGSKSDGRKLGTLTDVSFLSFGRDKSISSVFGGAIVCRDGVLSEKIEKLYVELKYPKPMWTLQQIIHPVLFSLILPLYTLGYKKLTIGKIILVLSQKLHILSKPLTDREKRGYKPDNYPELLPSALALMAQNQLHKIDRFIKTRREVSQIYSEALREIGLELPKQNKGTVLMRYPILVENRDSLIKYAKSKNVLLGDWYKKVIVPSDNLKAFDYTVSSCPKSEKISKMTVNLPTYPNMSRKDANKVLEVIKLWLNTKI